METSAGLPLDVDIWRQRWRAAAESTFATLIADPDAYARALETVGAIAADFRQRGAGLEALVQAMAAPDEVRTATAGATPPGVPMALLVGVACSLRERELIVMDVRDKRRRAIQEARTAGRAWAVLEGPESVEELTGGRSGSGCSVALHLDSGTELRAAVDAWAPEPYRIDVVAPGGLRGEAFTQREEWLAEVQRLRGEIEAP